jgi:hypothetical protein
VILLYVNILGFNKLQSTILHLTLLKSPFTLAKFQGDQKIGQIFEEKTLITVTQPKKQNINTKVHFESPKQLHQTTFEATCLSENAKQ